MTASAEDRAPGEQVKMTVSERSLGVARRGPAGLARRPPGQPERPDVSGVRMPENGGLSSTSVLFEAAWSSGGTPHRGAYVARMAPEAERGARVPHATTCPASSRLIERGRRALRGPAARLCAGTSRTAARSAPPFFVMDQVDGRVPLDNPPYVFGGWLLDATPEERADLQRASVAILADLHAIPDPRERVRWLGPPPAELALRWHVDQQHAYYRWALADDGFRIPIIERSLDWLERALASATPAPTCCPGATRGSATSSTTASRPRPCSTGRWPRSARARSTSAGSCSCTGSSRTSPSSSRCPACPTSSAAPRSRGCYAGAERPRAAGHGLLPDCTRRCGTRS